MGEIRDRIFAKDDLPRKEVFVPEWNETVYVRILDADQKDAFDARFVNAKLNGQAGSALQRIRAWVVVACCVDADGNQIFTDKDIAAVGRKSNIAIDRIVDAAMELNALRPQDVEELKKSSEPIQGETFTSD